MNTKIKEVLARAISDSRGNPTIEAAVIAGRYIGKAAVPSGASKGMYEAVELRDRNGKGVSLAVDNVNIIINKALVGKEVHDQAHIDNLMIELDGTKNKSKLGANAILSTSLAVARVRAKVLGKPLYASIDSNHILPLPFMNIINGGRHAKNSLPFQEYMIVPHFSTFGESLSASTEVFGELRKIIAKKYGKESTVMGDEGGFAPNISDVEEPLRLIQTAVDRLGYEKEFKFAIDVAASEFYRRPIPGFEGHYLVNGKQLAHHKMIEIYENLISNYPIISIEDPFNQENFEEFAQFTKEFGKKVQVVGDDLLVTNLERLKHAVALKAGNALLLKVNQIGTLTEALEAARYALENKWHVMVSHRSGETMDTFISDLTVGIGCGQIKAGAPSKPERLAKYKRLIEIERELGNRAKYGRQ
jgi:enolase